MKATSEGRGPLGAADQGAGSRTAASVEVAGGEACLAMRIDGAPEFNESFAALWGVSGEEREALRASTGAATRDAFGAMLARRVNDPAAFLAALERLDPFGPEATRGEYALRDGRTIEGFGAPLRDASGRVQARVLFYRDVSRRRRDAEELSQRAARQAAIARLGRIAVESPAVAPLLEAAVGMLVETLGVPLAAVLELAPDDEHLVARATHGLGPDAVGESFGSGARTRLGVALLGSGPVVTCDAGHGVGVTSALLERRGVAASATALVRGKERPYGVLAAYACEPRPFSRDELGFLEATASVLGAAVARHRAEQATAERETVLRAVFDGTQDAMYVADSEGRILDANPAAEALFATPRAALLGRSLRNFVRKGRERISDAQWERFLACGRQDAEIELQPPGRPPRSVEYTAIADILPGRHLTVLRDVTERRQLSTRIALSDKMISVGTMAAGVAHELNNPLAYVAANLSFVGDALGQLSGGDAPNHAVVAELSRAVAEAREGGERMRVIIRDLLSLSRSDEATRGPVDVTAVLESCVQMAWNEIRHRAALVKQLAPVPPVHGNAARLSQVFLNLLVNAAQAIPEGAAATHSIRVATRQAADGRVVIEVQDSGVGIAPEDLPRIFDPFFTTKPLGDGTGLGLSICHNIVTSHGGELEVESEPGFGCTFRVLLAPTRGVPASAAPTVAEDASPAPRGRVLVVDDEPLVGVALRRALARDHDVVVTGSAREALALVRGGDRFDVLLSDLLMPEMTGMDLHAALAAEAPDLARRMVFLTGGAFTPAARAFLDANQDRCVEKPFEVRALRELVRRRVIEGRQ